MWQGLSNRFRPRRWAFSHPSIFIPWTLILYLYKVSTHFVSVKLIALLIISDIKGPQITIFQPYSLCTSSLLILISMYSLVSSLIFWPWIKFAISQYKYYHENCQIEFVITIAESGWGYEGTRQVNVKLVVCMAISVLFFIWWHHLYNWWKCWDLGLRMAS